MPGTAIVLYPSKNSTRFDMDYYLSTHMPLVQEKWGPLGLTGWSVSELNPEQSGYQVQAILFWEDIENLKTASGGPTAAAVMGDIPNFTDAQPIIIGGTQIAQS